MIRFFGGRVMTLANDIETQDIEVWTEGSKIVFVGKPKAEELDGKVFEREYDLKGNLLMPSFKNAHTHSAMTFLRSYADDMPLQDWLFKQIFPMEAKLDGEKVYWLTKLAILEYLTTGCTAAFDMYFELDDYVKACVESGFRSVLCGAVSGDKSNLERLENNYLKYNNVDPLISFMLGFHAEYTCEKELIEGVGKLAEKYKAPVAMHNSETAKEVRECIEKYGMTPTELFDSFGIAPIVKMQDMGINIAIGTDGPASNNCLDMFREMFLMTGLQKIACDDASACPADSVLKAATVGSARAMGLSDCDIIAEGKQADLIVIDLFQPNMQPLNNIGKNLVYSGSKQNVKLTMCAGKVLYEDGEFRIGEEPAVIYKKANEIIESMKD